MRRSVASSGSSGLMRWALAAWAALALALSGQCAAQTVTLAGSMGADRALLLIDGQPRTVAVGSTVQGVTLRRLVDGQAEVVVDGRAITLRLGESPARLGGGAAGPASTEIVLPMGPGGHFGGQGAINGKPVQFLVDTGATTIALSQAEANRIGLDWKRGKPGLTATANGLVPVYAINLTSVRLGNVDVANVAAIVLPSEMTMVLLGNSFLGRFSMRQDSDVMRLEKKP